MKITRVAAHEIFDSRGLPTVQCIIELQGGSTVSASVPSGASRGSFEAVELRDGGKRLMGKGVLKAVDAIESALAPIVIGKVPNVVETDIEMLHMDGTDDKSRLGANAMLAVSIALCKAQALSEGMTLYELITYLCDFELISLPCPMFNMINGGAHASNKLQVQECMVVPVGISSFREAMEVGVTIFHALKNILRKKGKSTNVGDEGGFAPEFDDEQEALDCLVEAIEHAHLGENVSAMISLDIAASQFFDEQTKQYRWHGKLVSMQKLVAYYGELTQHYPLYSIEDGLHEQDWTGWQHMMAELSGTVQVVGDDLFATNAERIWQGISDVAANHAIIKPNQVGTVTETLQAVKLCKENDIGVTISHRSGETNDTFIADLAVGVSAPHIKAGGLCRGERMAKYNRLLAIENELVASHQS